MAKESLKAPELWGGLECSFNRVADLYFDQLQLCGHYDRITEDIDWLPALGVKMMRYPVIWERLQPRQGQAISWHETVTRPLEALRANGITPIAGLVHHGSGPRYADILSPAFAPGLSEFAGQVAQKYPWIEYYTPVNEPLTTARFSGLYGLWFPHQRDDRAFARAFMNEMKAIVLSMREIRKVNPNAKLVQTEDLAKIYSTPRLVYQANFENHRRWLTWDVLCGMLTPRHALWEYFIRSGLSEEDLRFFIDNPCPPDIIGADYYATSERYLDEDLKKYPPVTHGSNGIDRYADVAAFRTRHGESSGIAVLLKECWDRYHLPIAMTEVHINCDVDNQIRWFAGIRNTCIALMAEGIDVKAITAWSLFGSFGWNKLLTVRDGDYESGAFDMRSGMPLPTALAEYFMQLAADSQYVHPAENEKGWWRLEDRFIFERAGDVALIEKEDVISDCLNRPVDNP